MSTYALGLVTEFPTYRGAGHLVAMQLADFANTEGVVNETIEQMARRATISARQFRRILRNMEADGWIECIDRSKGGFGKGSFYRINPDWLRLPLAWRAAKSTSASGPVNPDITRTQPGHNPDITRTQPG
ncbi:MAG: hypothetical protein ABI728_07755, partial [Betaproteobacteria bacterium]